MELPESVKKFKKRAEDYIKKMPSRRKKYLALAAVGASFLFAACTSIAKDREINRLEKRVSDLDGAVRELQVKMLASDAQKQIADYLSGGESTDEKVNEVGEVEAKEEEKKVEEEISLGKKVTVDDIAEFQLDSCEWMEEILPSDTSKSYSYIQDIESETFLVFKGKIKNLAGVQYKPRYMSSGKVIINGKYEAVANVECEDEDKGGFYGEPKSLQELNLVIYVSVSNEVKEIFKEGELTLKIQNNPDKLEYFFNEDSDSYNTYTMKVTPEAKK